MKRYLLLFLAFTASFAMTAQDYVINPNPAHVDGFTNEGIVKLSSTKLFNNSADTSALKWRRVVVDIPSEWTSQVCDNNLCWGAEQDETPNDPLDFMVINPGGQGVLTVQVSPNGVAGTATINIEVFDPNNNDEIVATGVYTFTIAEPSNYVINPNPAHIVGDTSEGIVKLSSTRLFNNSADTSALKWRRVVVDIPSEWTSQVCDNNLCWGAEQDETPNDPLDYMAIDPGGQGVLTVQISPSGVAGTATINVEVFDPNNNDAIVATGVYTFEVTNEVVSSTENLNRKSIRIFPNPTTNSIQLTDNDIVKSLTIYNILGAKVKNFVANPGANYDISELVAGVYLVGLLDEEGKVIRTLRVLKK